MNSVVTASCAPATTISPSFCSGVHQFGPVGAGALAADTSVGDATTMAGGAALLLLPGPSTRRWKASTRNSIAERHCGQRLAKSSTGPRSSTPTELSTPSSSATISAALMAAGTPRRRAAETSGQNIAASNAAAAIGASRSRIRIMAAASARLARIITPREVGGRSAIEASSAVAASSALPAV